MAERINDDASTSATEPVENMQVDNEITSISTLVCVGIDCVRSKIKKEHWTAASARIEYDVRKQSIRTKTYSRTHMKVTKIIY